MVNGLFISFEGIDGSGKSTQARLLTESLKSETDVILTREPGGSEGAELIRRLLVEGDKNRWSAETELLLFTAARRDHLEKTIQPALEVGKTVITDRFADSTRVYQGVARADLQETVNALHDRMIGRDPDLTFIIDMDADAALERGLARKSGEDRFEDFGAAFQRALRTGFLDLAKTSERFHVIDGNRPPETVATDVLKIAQKALP